MLSPDVLLSCYDNGRPWSEAERQHASRLGGVEPALQLALQVRALRLARGEQPVGYKIGFTNSNIWPHYGVFAPIWGTVWDTTLRNLGPRDQAGHFSLANLCEPRLEPELVVGLAHTPPPLPSADDLHACIGWVAPGFEIVQSHCPGWKFTAAQTVADGALHGRLLVGRRVPVESLGSSFAQTNETLAQCAVHLRQGDALVESGRGANVLGGPLVALHQFSLELARCPGGPVLQAGDVITTGTWTDAWPLVPGQAWRAEFSDPLPSLSLHTQ